MNCSLAGQIMAAWTMGGNRGFPFQLRKSLLKPGGYVTFFEGIIRPWYAAGWRRFLIHRPFGEATTDALMDMDSAVALETSEYSHVLDDFNEAMDRAAVTMPEAVFVAYLGTHGQTLEALYTSGKHAAHWGRMLASVESLLDRRNVAIAFDNMVAERFTDSHPASHFVQMVKAYKSRQGMPTIVEALPRMPANSHAGQTWVREMDALVLERLAVKHRGRGTLRTSSPHADTYVWLLEEDHAGECSIEGVSPWLGQRMAEERTIPVVAADLFSAGVPEYRRTLAAGMQSAVKAGLKIRPEWTAGRAAA